MGIAAYIVRAIGISILGLFVWKYLGGSVGYPLPTDFVFGVPTTIGRYGLAVVGLIVGMLVTARDDQDWVIVAIIVVGTFCAVLLAPWVLSFFLGTSPGAMSDLTKLFEVGVDTLGISGGLLLWHLSSQKI